MKKYFVFTVLLFLLQVSSAWGDQFRIGNSPGSPFLLNNTELFEMADNFLQFDFNPDNKANPPTRPIYLLLGIPFAGSDEAPLINSVAGSSLSLSPSFKGNLTSTSASPYSLANLSGSSSQKWSNWINAYDDLIGGTLPDHFAIFLYDLTSKLLDYSGTLTSVGFDGSLAAGTFAFGYAKDEDSNKWVTPFTVSGFVTPHESVPEPATMILLVSGLIGLAAIGRKKFFKNNSTK